MYGSADPGMNQPIPQSTSKAASEVGEVRSFRNGAGVDKGVVVEQMAEGGGAWALVGMEKGDEWDPPGIGVGAGAVLGVY